MKNVFRNLLICLGICAVALLVSNGALADNRHEHVTGNDGHVRIVVVDDDGNRDEQVFEFDSDHPRPFLGVVLIRSSSDEGIRVGSVVEDSGADRAGIQKGDIIVSIDGKEVDSTWDLTHTILQTEPGDRVDVEVLRDGNRQTLTAEIGEQEGFAGNFAFGFDPEELEEQMERLSEQLEGLDLDLDMDMERLSEQLEGLDQDFDFDFDFDFEGIEPHIRHLKWSFGHGRPKLGVELVGTTPELRQHLGAADDEGVLVGRVMSDMPAEIAGIQVGDLIVGVEGETIGSVGDLRRALNDVDGVTIDIEVIRDGQPMTLRAPMPEMPEDDGHDFRLHREQKDREAHAAPASQRS